MPERPGLLTALNNLPPRGGNGGRPPGVDGPTLQQYINLTDAEYECAHGRLPLDRNKPPECKCWTPARTGWLASRRHLAVEDHADDA